MCDYILTSNKSRITGIFDLNTNESEWYVKEIIGNYSVILIDETDYIYINNIKIQSNEIFYNRENFNNWFKNKLLRLGIVLEYNNHSYLFKSKKSIFINNYSYYFSKTLNLKNNNYISIM